MAIGTQSTKIQHRGYAQVKPYRFFFHFNKPATLKAGWIQTQESLTGAHESKWWTLFNTAP